VTIHASDPFATPDDAKSPVRRLRGRLPAPVTLWTAYDRAGRRAGLTVSSTVVVDGAPGRLLGILDEESGVWEAIGQTGRFAMMPLRIGDDRLADTFAGLMPAPGGPFRDRDWTTTAYGPVFPGVGAWAGCRLDGARAFGWGLLVEATIEQVSIEPVAAERKAGPGGEAGPLVHYRGRYAGGDERRGTDG
jgi:flavin reductase (DIM6/NTAB) family NADH-FMN oxidoreductase RutF